MRADRLLSILLLLQNHERLTSKELAEKLEVSERTIHRDMEALSGAGVPVYAERGASGGWSLSHGYRSNLTGLKTDELLSLLLASPTTLLRDLGMDESFDDALSKLESALPKTVQQSADNVRERLHIDGAGWHQSDETFPYLTLIQEAVWQERKLLIRYNRSGTEVERLIHPLGLVAKRRVWYLVAQVEEDLRTYRISRFISVQMLEESFVRPESFELASFWEQSTQDFKAALPRYPARIWVREQAMDRLAAERYVKIASTQSIENDWIEAEVEFHTLESACELVLGYGAQIKVIEPAPLRDKIIEVASATISLYL
ncbi:transcriptional regulator [Brevibacillus reuszeri]|uniref:helix-turn-helix transcriptional regulator n=1 Tax=Brevibacillus reuszeri TaxID=54915 RepID=UPI001B26C1D8|nr:YafY family protein [Brevibacillus reuszeri]GIO05766.1 transcriptional regulator [Brevibacillus reuszeri]